MSLAFGGPRCLLVVAPHPDDEAIGAHALIARMRRRRVEVRILVVTDGHASHRGSARWPRSRLVRERRRETRRAMRGIGVPAGKIRFMGLPDGALSTVVALAHRQIGRDMRRAPTPLLVLAPSFEDDHPDHRVTALSRPLDVRACGG